MKYNIPRYIHYTSLVWVAIIGSMLSSCKMEQEELFELSAAQRIEKATNDIQEILTSAPNGWVMEYYYGGSGLEYGGTPITMSFSKDGSVSVRTLNAINDPSGSLYSVMADDGITLNFNTFNRNFHYFSDSDRSDGGGLGNGFEGDYEFIVDSYTPDEIVLTGKKYYARIHMYPLKSDAVSYLTTANSLAEKYTAIPAVYGLEGTLKGTPITVGLSSQQNFTLTVGEETKDLPFMFTNEGIKLYEPVTFGDYTLNDLSFDEEKMSFISSDGQVTLNVLRNPLGLLKKEYVGKYMISYKPGNVTKEVELIDAGGTALYLRGLLNGADLVVQYDELNGVLNIVSQRIAGTTYLACWNTGTGDLTWGINGLGMKSKWNGDHDNFVLTFEHNGVEWIAEGKLLPIDAFIVWNSQASEDKSYGDSRFQNITLTKLK